jgi:hypothetical protein
LCADGRCFLGTLCTTGARHLQTVGSQSFQQRCRAIAIGNATNQVVVMEQGQFNGWYATRQGTVRHGKGAEMGPGGTNTVGNRTHLEHFRKRQTIRAPPVSNTRRQRARQPIALHLERPNVSPCRRQRRRYLRPLWECRSDDGTDQNVQNHQVRQQSQVG